MRQEAVSVGRPRLVLTASEDDVATDGIGSRMDILGRIFGLPSRVHADVAKVVSEAGLHESSSLGVERPPGGSKRRVGPSQVSGMAKLHAPRDLFICNEIGLAASD